MEAERNEKDETKNQLLTKNKEVDLNSTKMFEGTYTFFLNLCDFFIGFTKNYDCLKREKYISVP